MSHKEFCQVRNFAHSLDGGWGQTFPAVAEDVARAVSMARGFENCFAPERVVRKKR